jgi:hypothetical protein
MNVWDFTCTMTNFVVLSTAFRGPGSCSIPPLCVPGPCLASTGRPGPTGTRCHPINTSRLNADSHLDSSTFPMTYSILPPGTTTSSFPQDITSWRALSSLLRGILPCREPQIPRCESTPKIGNDIQDGTEAGHLCECHSSGAYSMQAAESTGILLDVSTTTRKESDI